MGIIQQGTALGIDVEQIRVNATFFNVLIFFQAFKAQQFKTETETQMLKAKAKSNMIQHDISVM